MADDFDGGALLSDLSQATGQQGNATPAKASPAPATKGVRTNNPGNLMPGGKQAQFASAEDGLKAMDNNLSAYGKQGINTLSGIANKWAPASVAGNNPDAYAADMAKRLGIGVNDPIDLGNPLVRHAVSTGIMLHENGSKGIFGSKTTAAAPAPQAQDDDSGFDGQGLLTSLNQDIVPGAEKARQAAINPPPQSATPKVAPGMNDDQIITALGGNPALVKKAADYQPGMFANALTEYQKNTQQNPDLQNHKTAAGVMQGIADFGNGLHQALVHGEASLGMASPADVALADLNNKFYNSYYQHQLLNDQAPAGPTILGQKVDAARTVGNMLPALAGGGSVVAAGKGMGAKMLGGAAVGAGYGALAPAAGNDSYASQVANNAAAGAVTGAALPVVGKVVGKVAAPVMRPLSDLLDKARERIGAAVDEAVPDTMGQLQQAADQQAASAAKPHVRVQAGGAVPPNAIPASPAPQTQAKPSPELQTAIDKAKANGDINQDALNRHLEADSLPVRMTLTKGQATQDVNQLSLEQNSRGKNEELANTFNRQNGDLIKNFDAIRDQAAPDVTSTNETEHGQALVDSYKKMDADARDHISEKYQALQDANGGRFPVDGKAFADKALSDLSNSDVEEMLPGEVRRAVQAYQGGKDMDFNRFTGMQKILGSAARKADQAGDGNASHAIGIVRDALENLPMSSEVEQNIKPLADAARAAAKARFDQIKADPAYKAVVNDDVAEGQASPLADNFVSKYVVGGKGADVAQMQRNLGADPIARQTITAGTIDHLKKASGIDLRTNTGNVSQAMLNKNLSNLRGKYSVLFNGNTAKQLNTLGNVARYTQFQPRGSFVNNSNTFVSQLAHGAASAAEGVANAKAGGLPVGTLVRKAIEKKSDRIAIKKMLEPGAGISE